MTETVRPNGTVVKVHVRLPLIDAELGLLKYPITLIIPAKGEGKAHACVKAWLQQLTLLPG